MHGVRDYVRMVVRKIQKYPAAEVDKGLHKDVTELFRCVHFFKMSLEPALDFNNFTSNLVCVQETLLKHIGSRVFLAQRDKESLNALKIRVHESRNTFEVTDYT